MEINIYQTYEEWMKEIPSYVVEGDLVFWGNGLVILKTYKGSSTYQQILSSHQVFAITYHLPTGFLMYHDNIHLYKDIVTWNMAEPDVSLEGQMNMDESTNDYVSIITKDGYKQIIFLAHLFAAIYERR